MLLKGFIVIVVVWGPRILPVAKEAALVLISAVLIQLVVVVEALSAEGTERMAPEPCLVDRAWTVVAVAHVLFELLVREQVLLMRKDLFVSNTKITHFTMVCGPDMSLEIMPSEASVVARLVRTVVTQKQHRVAHDILARISDADIVIRTTYAARRILLIALCCVIGEDNVRRLGLPPLGQSCRLPEPKPCHSPYNGDSLCSCTVLSSAAHMYDM